MHIFPHLFFLFVHRGKYFYLPFFGNNFYIFTILMYKRHHKNIFNQ